MVWWPFATKPERADTSEVTDLHSGAPPLYSTSFVVNGIKVIGPDYPHRSLKSENLFLELRGVDIAGIFVYYGG